MPVTRKLTVLGSDTEGDWTQSAMKVAFASTDMKTVNQHFGSAQSLVLYAVDVETSNMLEVVEFGKLAQDGNEDKLSVKIEALDGCIAVYSQAVGASAVKQLKARGIHPVKVSAGAEIVDLLESLQEELRMGPSMWLANAIKAHMMLDPSRFDEMEAEGWEE